MLSRFPLLNSIKIEKKSKIQFPLQTLKQQNKKRTLRTYHTPHISLNYPHEHKDNDPISHPKDDLTKEIIDSSYSYDDLKNMDLGDVVANDEIELETKRLLSLKNTQAVSDIQALHKNVEPEFYDHIVGDVDRQTFTGNEIGKANSYFKGQLKWKPVADSSEIAPSELPEICFIGRSNVGKSSLLNAMIGIKASKVGKTPGRTQMIHYIEVVNKVCIVDLPGYGFARVSKEQKKRMSELLDSYIASRENVAQRIICFLVDIRHGLRREEHHIMNQLDQLHTIYIVVMTKSDKVKHSDAQRIAQGIEKTLKNHPKCFPEVFLTSSTNPSSLDTLKGALHRLCEGLDAEQ